MAFADDHPGYRLNSSEEAQRWIAELTASVEEARKRCDVVAEVGTVRDAQRAAAVWMTRHGSALGALQALHRAGLLGDVAYNQLRDRVMATSLPTVTEINR